MTLALIVGVFMAGGFVGALVMAIAGAAGRGTVMAECEQVIHALEVELATTREALLSAQAG